MKLPEKSSILDVSVTVREAQLEGTFSVLPAPSPSIVGSQPPRDSSEDATTYASKSLFPDKWYTYREGHGLDAETNIRVKYVIITLFPLRFLPAEKKVIRAVDVYVKVSYVEESPLTTPSSFKNLIITSPAFETYALQLAQWKNQTGVSSRVANTTWIYHNYGGIDRQEQIRTCIKDFVASYGIIYVTIFGDADIVPVRMAYVPDGEDTYTPTDLYYADLDGTWDDNNDQVYADQMYDNVDGIPDVYVGRIPPSLASYAQVAVDKIIGYQSQFNSSQSWTRRIVLAAGTGSGDGFSNPFGIAFPYLKNYTASFCSGNEIVKLYESYGNLSTASMSSQVNQGSLFLNFAGHGNPGMWLFYWVFPPLGMYNGYGVSDVQALTNGYRLPVITTQSCSTAQFDDTDCIGEWFVLEPDGGGIGYFGSTRIAWGFPDEGIITGLMGEMDWRIYQNYYEGFTRLGQMWGESVSEYVQSHISNYASASVYDVKTFMEFVLLGDPTIRIYNPDYPETLNVPEDFATIQGAINSAYEGDTVLVFPGTYYESIILNKTVSLVGEDVNTTILNGGGSGAVVSVVANNSCVDGFTITSGSTGIKIGAYDYSLKIASGNLIVGNLITNVFCGIYVEDGSSNNTISMNAIEANGEGIELGQTSNNTLFGNSITGNNGYDGIYWVSASDSNISRNRVRNFRYGINFYGGAGMWGIGENNVLMENDIAVCEYGIYFDGCWNNDIIGNTVSVIQENGISLVASAGSHYYYVPSTNNTVSQNSITSSHYGILIAGSWNNEIVNNVIKDNVYGVSLCWVDNFVSYEYSHDNKIINNNITDNEYGVSLSASNFTSISGNNLAGNTFGIYSDSSSYSSITGNTITNSSSGIDAWTSLYNSVIGNTIINSELGISYVYDSSYYNIVGNTIVNSSDGITLFEASNDGIIRGNTIMNSSCGISNLAFCYNVTIIENTLVNNGWGIRLDYAYSINIRGNNITDNEDGIFLHGVYASIVENEISGSSHGIYLVASDFSSISENNIADNMVGVYFSYSSNNTIYHNNFVNNAEQAYIADSANVWDNGYPSGGNYWSDYAGLDLCWGSYQNKTGSDGIGDSPYVIDGSNRDNYPLMSPYEYWSNPIPGDINKDMNVNSEDLSQIAVAYGSALSEPEWNPNCDIDGNGKVDVLDLFGLGKNYGENVQTIGANAVEKVSPTTTLWLPTVLSTVGVLVGARAGFLCTVILTRLYS
jgi:parallel beta-helix repeat protein